MRAAGGWWALARALTGRLPTLDQIAWGDRMAVHAAVRRLSRAVALGDGDVLCRVLGRYKMLLDGRDLSLTPHLALDGYWEMSLTRALLRTLRPGMHAADVGANVGYHTLVMAARVGPSGRVTAFEPNPGLARRLGRSLVLNGFGERVRVHAAAAGAVDGEATTLHFDPDFLGGGHLADPGPRPGLESVSVTVRRLDAIPDAASVDLVKIDAEGSEAAVWAGMSGLLAGPRLRTVILEWEPTCHADPVAALGGYAQAGFGFGLADQDGDVRPVDATTLLAVQPGRATMLVLRR